MTNNLTEQFIFEHRTDDVRKLALGPRPEGIDMQYALTQISGWQAARVKIPRWADTDGIIYPQHLSMEQCTSQHIADYKAAVIENRLGKGIRLADLTGGFGVDCCTLSRSASKTCYNEMSSELCNIARNNFPALGRPEIEVICGTAQDFIKSCTPDSLDLIYLDPARRGDAGRKLISIKDCQPDVTALQDSLLNISKHVMVKLSPMLDVSRVTLYRYLKKYELGPVSPDKKK